MLLPLSKKIPFETEISETTEQGMLNFRSKVLHCLF